MSNQAGKGSRPRPVDKKTWDENYDKIFKKRKTVAEWAEHFGDRIKSYDGFREYNQDDLLTEKEYQNGLPHCTMYVELRKCECGYGKVCPSDAVCDGHGMVVTKCERLDCGLHVVRPGKVQCWCDDEKHLDSSEFLEDS